jgi:hypothetical protein
MPEANDASEQVEVEEFSCTPVTQVECVIGGQKRTFATERDAKLAFTRVKYEARAKEYCERNSIDGKVAAARVNVIADFLADEELAAEEA